MRLWNPAAARMTGLEQAEVTGRAAADVLAGWPLEPAGERAQAFPYDGPSGERWLSLTAGAFPHGTVYAFRDLTDERAVEQIKSDFVSTVSHELRTPLAAIYGAAMTLRRDDIVLSPTSRRMLGVIAGESERLAKIVNDILLASRLDSVPPRSRSAGPTRPSSRAPCSRPPRPTCDPGSSSRSPPRTRARTWRPTRTGCGR